MGQAQEDGKIVLKGVVQDARTNEPIPLSTSVCWER